MARDKVRVDSLADRMSDRLREIAEDRQARLQAKLDDGYRPQLNEHGQVVLVKVKEG